MKFLPTKIYLIQLLLLSVTSIYSQNESVVTTLYYQYGEPSKEREPGGFISYRYPIIELPNKDISDKINKIIKESVFQREDVDLESTAKNILERLINEKSNSYLLQGIGNINYEIYLENLNTEI